MNTDRRRLLLAAAAVVPLPACRLPARWASADAEVGGLQGFPSLSAALAAAPPGDRPYHVYLHPGQWHEKLVIRRANVHLHGAGAERSVLSHDTAAGHLDPATGQPWGTFGCATLIVRAPGFCASDLTIANAFDYPGHLAQPRLEQIGANGAQAVALMLDGGSAAAMLKRVHLRGHQDTLFVDAGHSSFRDCCIEGSVDFIFGAGQATFLDCELRSRWRPGKPRQGYVCAPSTARTAASGLHFQRCRLTREAGVPDGSVALARPWRPTRDFPDGRYGDPEACGSARFTACWMEAHIDRVQPWDPMAYTDREGRRVALSAREARFSAAHNRGPGAVNRGP